MRLGQLPPEPQGHLACLLALAADDPLLVEAVPAGVDLKVRACVGLYGVYDVADTKEEHSNPGLMGLWVSRVMKKSFREHPELFKQASPLHRVREDAPAMLLVQGSHDTMAPGLGAQVFADRLAAGVLPGRMPYAEAALDRGTAVLVYPGGDSEVFRPTSQRNRIVFEGRYGFVRLALKKQVPIVQVGGTSLAPR